LRQYDLCLDYLVDSYRKLDTIIMVPMYWNSVVVLISLWKRSSGVTKDGRVTFYGHGVKLERYGKGMGRILRKGSWVIWIDGNNKFEKVKISYYKSKLH
jgi:hypothetical protein